MVREYLRKRMDRAEKVYAQAITTLWAGNAGAALATLSFVAATWKEAGNFHRPLLVPLVLFTLGVIFMGAGSLFTLIAEGRAIKRLQRADSVLDLMLDDIETPAEESALSLSNPRTLMAFLAGIAFILGCVVGFVLMWTS